MCAVRESSAPQSDPSFRYLKLPIGAWRSPHPVGLGFTPSSADVLRYFDVSVPIMPEHAARAAAVGFGEEEEEEEEEEVTAASTLLPPPACSTPPGAPTLTPLSHARAFPLADKRLFKFVDSELGAGNAVLVHCLAGAHRAGTAGTACLMHLCGLDRWLGTTASWEQRLGHLGSILGRSSLRAPF